ncbi:ABC transporter permease [Halomarina oriensis]|uniref:ABC transporter permease subunit n=1 Tax=Halomarina oriensis TaxID=671145 RepID=A0A6B0GGP3_9EURY|nr:ABC transporter permease [Halomarina oriensis]MWG32891.1 ABC transporter permease subunit [Halomarina oriensis]
MARWLTALRRVAFAVVVVWVVVSLAWASIALTPDPNEAVERRAINTNDQLSDEEKAAALERLEGDADQPAVDRYLDWAGDFATFDWGLSTTQRRMGPDGQPEPMPVTAALVRAIPNTLRYVLPALVLAIGLGTALGTYAALVPDSRVARGASVAAYFGGGLPNFYLAVLVPVVVAIPLDLLGSGLPSTLGPVRVHGTLLPVLVLTLALLGSQIRHARTAALEYSRSDFVRLARAKGAGPFRLARHVLRNAALPLVALFVTEVLAVLVVDVFVIEYIFPVQGIGAIAYRAIFGRDLALVVGITAVVVATGVLGTLLQDLSYTYLDPRVGDDG